MNPSLPQPRALIFDWDNTLVQSWECIQQAMNATLQSFGQDPWDMAEVKQRVALSLRDSFPALFGSRWKEARELFYRSFSAIHLDLLTPLPGAAEVLRQLDAAGLPMAVVSNKVGGFLRQEAAHLGWNGLFRRLVGATDASADKPSAAPVRLALDAMGLAAGDHVWFVGDAAVDMECAYNSGCLPVLLRADAWADGEFDRYPPRHHSIGWEEFGTLVAEFLIPISPD